MHAPLCMLRFTRIFLLNRYMNFDFNNKRLISCLRKQEEKCMKSTHIYIYMHTYTHILTHIHIYWDIHTYQCAVRAFISKLWKVFRYKCHCVTHHPLRHLLTSFLAANLCVLYTLGQLYMWHLTFGNSKVRVFFAKTLRHQSIPWIYESIYVCILPLHKQTTELLKASISVTFLSLALFKDFNGYYRWKYTYIHMYM